MYVLRGIPARRGRRHGALRARNADLDDRAVTAARNRRGPSAPHVPVSRRPRSSESPLPLARRSTLTFTSESLAVSWTRAQRGGFIHGHQAALCLAVYPARVPRDGLPGVGAWTHRATVLSRDAQDRRPICRRGAFAADRVLPAVRKLGGFAGLSPDGHQRRALEALEPRLRVLARRRPDDPRSRPRRDPVRLRQHGSGPQVRLLEERRARDAPVGGRLLGRWSDRV